MLKKIFSFIIITIVTLVCLAFLLPIVLKKKIIETSKLEIHQNINGQMDFDDADISFLKHFPKVWLSIDNFRLVGVDDFANDTLLSARNIQADISWKTFLAGKNIHIYNLNLTSPRIHAIVLVNGKANWNISKKQPSLNNDIDVKLEKYAVSNAYIRYNDETTNQHTEIKDFTHQGTGDFAAERFLLQQFSKPATDDIP